MKNLISTLAFLGLSITLAFAQATTTLPTISTTPTMKVENLAGVGTRPVYANASGTLTTNYTPPTTTTTSYYSVPAAEFRRSQGGNINFINGEVSGAAGSVDTLIAPVNLPHGAVMTKFTFCYKDNIANTFMEADMMNTTVITPNRTVVKNASVTTPNVAAGNNYGCVDGTITIPNIANDKNSYWIRVYPNNGQGDNANWVAGLRIVHFIIQYQLSN